MRPPKISSIIRPAWNIYRTNFKSYYSLALIGSFWMLIPIYGWAKYTTMMGLLTRLAYGELIGNPESVAEAKQNIKPKMWSFLNLGWRTILRFLLYLWIKSLTHFVKFGGIFLVAFCISGLISVVFTISWLQSLSMLLAFAFLIVFLCAELCYCYLFMSRLCLYELPLAVEVNINVGQSIDFAEQLVENYSFPIRVIIFIFTFVFAIFMLFVGVVINLQAEKIYDLIANSLFLIANLPVGAIFLLCLWFINLIYLYSIWLALVFVPPPTSMFLLFPLTSFSGDKIYIFSILYLSIAALFIPLWQSIKAVIYYRLKLRNEYRNLLPDRST